GRGWEVMARRLPPPEWFPFRQSAGWEFHFSRSRCSLSCYLQPPDWGCWQPASGACILFLALIFFGGTMAKPRRSPPPAPNELDQLIHVRLRLGIVCSLAVHESLTL